MESIILSGNNGSVPDPYYHQFSLTFFDDGNSELEIKTGRPPNERVIHQKRQKNTPEENHELLKEARQLPGRDHKSLGVGGPEKFIEIKDETGTSRVLQVGENTREAAFFLKCIDHFSAGLRTRLADVI